MEISNSIELSKFYLEHQINKDYTEGMANTILRVTKISSQIVDNIYPGYRNGVVLVKLPIQIFTDTVVIRPDDKLIAKYESRIPGETPRKKIYVVRDSEPELAKSVFAVLYSKEVLAEDGDVINSDWAIVAHITSLMYRPQPMDPTTLIYNHFHLDGGTNTTFSSMRFQAELFESVKFWQDKAHVVYQ